MASKINLFPVGNGDMTLVRTETGRNILNDLNIRDAADDPNDDTPDVADELKKRLNRDAEGRRFLDALHISHPHKDHCAGLEKHFHLGPPGDWSKRDDKILIREIWSSPMVFRRASRNIGLCEDAKAFNREARRRVQKFRDNRGIVVDGDRILILGEDENGKTDDLEQILVRVGGVITRICGEEDSSFSALLLAPFPIGDEEAKSSQNQTSTILRISLAGDRVKDACRFLTGGDADVGIWERLWLRHLGQPDPLSYDVLLAPHHCSWRSLSHESWSDMREKAQVSENARNALSQAKQGAMIVVSSKPIKDDDDDPPCFRAKREYQTIANRVKGTFKCVGEHPSEKFPDVLEIVIGKYGPRLKACHMTGAAAVIPGIVGAQPLHHG